MTIIIKDDKTLLPWYQITPTPTCGGGRNLILGGTLLILYGNKIEDVLDSKRISNFFKRY